MSIGATFYKYAIRERLAAMDPEIRVLLNKIIPVQLWISRATWTRYMSIELGDNQEIGSQTLDRIAVFLGCSADDLKLYKVNESQLTVEEMRRIAKREALL